MSVPKPIWHPIVSKKCTHWAIRPCLKWMEGTLVRTPVEHVASSGRNTQGVTLIRLSKDEKLVAMARVEHEEDDDELVDAMREDGTLEVDGQEQIDIDAITDSTALSDANDTIDIANDYQLNVESADDDE